MYKTDGYLNRERCIKLLHGDRGKGYFHEKRPGNRLI